MDEGLSAAVVKVFVDLHAQGLIYRDKRLVNWDPKFQSAISDIEVKFEDVEGELDKVTGPDGEWVNPTLTADIAAGLDAARRAKQGEDL